jgi:hypothetical protein
MKMKMKMKKIKFEDFSFINPNIDDIITTINQKIAADRKGKTREENYRNIDKIVKPYLKRFNLAFHKGQSMISMPSANNMIVFMIIIVLSDDFIVENAYYQFQSVITNKKNERLFQFIKRLGDMDNNSKFKYFVE